MNLVDPDVYSEVCSRKYDFVSPIVTNSDLSVNQPRRSNKTVKAYV